MVADLNGKPLVWQNNTAQHTTDTTASHQQQQQLQSLSQAESQQSGVLETLFQLHENWTRLEKSGYALVHPMGEDSAAVRASMMATVTAIRDDATKRAGKRMHCVLIDSVY